MLFDILITIDQEVLITLASFIWSTNWSLGKILYFSTRYPAVIEGVLWLIYLNASPISIFDTLRFSTSRASWAFFIPLQSINISVIIVLRTSAIWGCKRVVTAFLGIVCITADLTALVLLAKAMKRFRFTFDNVDLYPLLGCLTGTLHDSTTGTVPVWSAVLIFDTTIFILTFAKAIYSYKYSHGRLLTMLIRDGFVYYAVMLDLGLNFGTALGIANLIFLCAMSMTRSGLISCLLPVLRASVSVIGSRLVLNLRGAASQNVEVSIRAGGNVGSMKLVDLSYMSFGGSTALGTVPEHEQATTAEELTELEEVNHTNMSNV
ncbi:uncharacterized protein FOMMEDRAFT_29532 [Fomitiporia mediterranea MF3/22]|uniref:uncharacterized protein n=1 Tax=Fomitiporia mediterranea (strain MF3/22) TaxID=694068 RepID=UPI000440819B|nr:uncharacterized protein FOMMEDRAFT_29532 [Fomitiporia mediterranea MF3/22]EJD02538.1 hypothetical protein FOMMEDRAFT_29532 [Fomitiporia mediterranea MF3/22]